jgi:molecular chaperone DnaK (HSP70)
MQPIFGIDLGTRTLRVAKFDGKSVEIERGSGRFESNSGPTLGTVLRALLHLSSDARPGQIRAVLTMPANFHSSDQEARVKELASVGIQVERVITSSTAAAIAYGVQTSFNGRVAVLDLGHSSFNMSILDVGDGVFEVLGTDGDSHLGGDDFDNRLLDFFADEFRKNKGFNVRTDPMALKRLKQVSESVKVELSSRIDAVARLSFISSDQYGPKHLHVPVSRSQFEARCGELFDRIRAPCERAMRAAQLTAGTVGKVVLVGGAARIPRLQKLAMDIFGTTELESGINHEELAVIGAALLGGVMTGNVKNVLLLDVTPLPLGVETLGGVMTSLIGKNTTVPTSIKEVFTTAADNQTSVTIHVLEGDQEFAKDNRSLGCFELSGIAPAPRGQPRIEVEFCIDARGTLSVSAIDKATGKRQALPINGLNAPRRHNSNVVTNAIASANHPAAATDTPEQTAVSVRLMFPLFDQLDALLLHQPKCHKLEPSAEDIRHIALAVLDTLKRCQHDVSAIQDASQIPLRQLILICTKFKMALALEPLPSRSKLQSAYAEMKQLLLEHGIQFITPNRGDQFDPHEHEAVAVCTTSNLGKGLIDAVFQSGCRTDRIVIRAARVRVSS